MGTGLHINYGNRRAIPCMRTCLYSSTCGRAMLQSCILTGPLCNKSGGRPRTTIYKDRTLDIKPGDMPRIIIYEDRPLLTNLGTGPATPFIRTGLSTSNLWTGPAVTIREDRPLYNKSGEARSTIYRTGNSGTKPRYHNV